MLSLQTNKLLEIKEVSTTTYHLQTDGLMERYIRTLVDIFEAVLIPVNSVVLVNQTKAKSNFSKAVNLKLSTKTNINCMSVLKLKLLYNG